MPSKVVLRECPDYAPERVAEAVRACLEPLGGIATFVKPGDRVVLKVNLLLKAKPEKCVTTNPEVVRQVGLLCLEAGASSVTIADSPGGRDTTPEFAVKAFGLAGFAAVAKELGSPCVLLSDDVVETYTESNVLFKPLRLGRLATEADVLINLPKLKTHGMMMFTGAVKNFFGLIPGIEKAVFHARVPHSADFAEMLLDIHNACPATLNLMDAVLAMEGDGPSGGTPRVVGCLLAGTDAPALDAVAEHLAGFAYGTTYVDVAAQGRGLLPKKYGELDIDGDSESFVVRDFRKAHDTDLGAKIPTFLQRPLRSAIIPRPELVGDSRKKCPSCGTCRDNCPVEAITLETADGKPAFDYGKCIRCLCCQELCPSHVITTHVPWLARLL